MTKPISLTGYPTGATIYVFPSSQSLADWTTYRVLMVEGTGDDAGLYTASVDPANGTEWLAFVGSSQPTWADAILGVVFSIENSAEVVAAIKADSVLGTAGMVADVTAVRKLSEGDEIIELESGVYKRNIYERGTNTKVIPSKGAKQPGGDALTNPATQQLAGFRE